MLLAYSLRLRGRVSRLKGHLDAPLLLIDAKAKGMARLIQPRAGLHATLLLHRHGINRNIPDALRAEDRTDRICARITDDRAAARRREAINVRRDEATLKAEESEVMLQVLLQDLFAQPPVDGVRARHRRNRVEQLAHLLGTQEHADRLGRRLTVAFEARHRSIDMRHSDRPSVVVGLRVGARGPTTIRGARESTEAMGHTKLVALAVAILKDREALLVHLLGHRITKDAARVGQVILATDTSRHVGQQELRHNLSRLDRPVRGAELLRVIDLDTFRGVKGLELAVLRLVQNAPLLVGQALLVEELSGNSLGLQRKASGQDELWLHLDKLGC